MIVCGRDGWVLPTGGVPDPDGALRLVPPLACVSRWCLLADGDVWLAERVSVPERVLPLAPALVPEPALDPEAPVAALDPLPAVVPDDGAPDALPAVVPVDAALDPLLGAIVWLDITGAWATAALVFVGLDPPHPPNAITAAGPSASSQRASMNRGRRER